jgi:hypothetical protein
MKAQNQDIADFLESIPEWAEYYEHELLVVNEVLSKKLGHQEDSRKRKKSEKEHQTEDDIFVMNFLNRFNHSQDDDDEDDEDDVLKHSDSYERSGRKDPDEEILGITNSDEQEVN